MTAADFALVCRFIFETGDRQTYCNRYNQNPHFEFDTFDAWLNPQRAPSFERLDEVASITLRTKGEQWKYADVWLADGTVHTSARGEWSSDALAEAVRVMLATAKKTGSALGPYARLV
ncbi:MAG: hypothetical protein GQE15_03490 [Archangiaceae bacterium]|nr:hypothetical protein [Archangiaceae bacterium]